MVAFKAAEVESFMARPDPGKPIVLVFGPDAGLVRERAAALVRSCVDDPSDPFGFAILEGDTLAEMPERLVEEAHTVPLFGGRRAVLVKAGGRNFSAAVERLVAAPAGLDCRIIIEGGDRGASRSEIEKLTLYALGENRIDVPDVMAVVADATIPAVDGLIDAAFAGWASDVEINFGKVQSSGVSASAIAAALVRQTAALHLFRLAVESGTSIDDLFRRTTPAIHFSRVRAVRAALESWTSSRLERLIAQLGETSLEVRKNSKLAYPIIQRALISVAMAARHRE